MVKLYMLLTVPVTAFLWAFGGADGTSKAWRRFGVPFTIAYAAVGIYAYNATQALSWHFILLVIPFLWGMLTIGYGRGDSSDEGSPLGRFWFWVLKNPGENRFNMSEATAEVVDIATRFTVGVLYGIALIPLAIIGSILSYIIGLLFIAINTTAWGALVKDEGMFHGLLVEEMLIGAGVAVGAYLMIL